MRGEGRGGGGRRGAAARTCRIRGSLEGVAHLGALGGRLVHQVIRHVGGASSAGGTSASAARLLAALAVRTLRAANALTGGGSSRQTRHVRGAGDAGRRRRGARGGRGGGGAGASGRRGRARSARTRWRLGRTRWRLLMKTNTTLVRKCRPNVVCGAAIGRDGHVAAALRVRAERRAARRFRRGEYETGRRLRFAFFDGPTAAFGFRARSSSIRKRANFYRSVSGVGASVRRAFSDITRRRGRRKDANLTDSNSVSPFELENF